jgi:hypothetical protein
MITASEENKMGKYRQGLKYYLQKEIRSKLAETLEDFERVTTAVQANIDSEPSYFEKRNE